MVGKSWYVSRNGKRRGPLSDDQLKQAVANGKVTHRDFVWYDGLQDWVEAGKVKGLFASPPPPPSRQGTLSSRSASRQLVPCDACAENIPPNSRVCPYCNEPVSDYSSWVQSTQAVVDESTRRAISTQMLVAGVANLAFGLLYVSTVIGAVIGVPMFALGLCELLNHSKIDSLDADQLKSKASLYGTLDIIAGLFNLVSLICGILTVAKSGNVKANPSL